MDDLATSKHCFDQHQRSQALSKHMHSCKYMKENNYFQLTNIQCTIEQIKCLETDLKRRGHEVNHSYVNKFWLEKKKRMFNLNINMVLGRKQSEQLCLTTSNITFVLFADFKQAFPVSLPSFRLLFQCPIIHCILLNRSRPYARSLSEEERYLLAKKLKSHSEDTFLGGKQQFIWKSVT